MAPPSPEVIRRANLISLEFEKHVYLRPGGVSTLSVLSAENKSGTPQDFDIPDELARMYQVYRDDIASEVLGRKPIHVFATNNEEEGVKSDGMLWYLIKFYTKKYLGFSMNPHVFRHLAAKIVLDEEPGAHVSVQQLLGHKKLQTTANYYAGLNVKRAQRHHNDLLGKKLSEHQTRSKGRKQTGEGNGG